MRQAIVTCARLLLAAIFIVFGLNGFYRFMEVPTPHAEAARVFLSGLAGSGYFIPFLNASEVAGGLMLLSNFFAPLGLLILAPIILNILAFHLFAAGSAGPEFVVVLLEIIVVWGFRERFRSVFSTSPSK